MRISRTSSTCANQLVYEVNPCPTNPVTRPYLSKRSQQPASYLLRSHPYYILLGVERKGRWLDGYGEFGRISGLLVQLNEGKHCIYRKTYLMPIIHCRELHYLRSSGRRETG